MYLIFSLIYDDLCKYINSNTHHDILFVVKNKNNTYEFNVSNYTIPELNKYITEPVHTLFTYYDKNIMTEFTKTKSKILIINDVFIDTSLFNYFDLLLPATTNIYFKFYDYLKIMPALINPNSDDLLIYKSNNELENINSDYSKLYVIKDDDSRLDNIKKIYSIFASNITVNKLLDFIDYVLIGLLNENLLLSDNILIGNENLLLIREEVSGQVSNNLIRQEVNGQLPSNLIREEVNGQVPNNLIREEANGQVPNGVNGRVPSEANGQLPSEANGRLPSNLIREETNSPVPSEANAQVHSEASGQLPSNLIREETNSQVHCETSDRMPSNLIREETNSQVPCEASDRMPSEANGQLPRNLIREETNSQVPSETNGQLPRNLIREETNSQMPSEANG